MSGESGAQQGLGDLEALVLPRNVLDDAEEVASIDPIRERASLVSALEDSDAVDDGVEWISCDGAADVAFWIVEVEPGEGTIEDVADEGVLASLERLASFLLPPQPRLEGSAGLIDLVEGWRFSREDFDP